MPLDPKRADLLIQYALLLAGEEDEWFSRQLGPIHLIKYVYLADLAYAQRFGASFSGADWRFHNFGPWDVAVYERIEPALKAIHAEQLKFESDYGREDWVRYRLRDTERLNRIEGEVPGAIKLTLRNQIHKFLGDTPSLLDFVYKTEPMLSAAPGENLRLASTEAELPKRASFQTAEFRISADDDGEAEDEPKIREEQLSNKRRKRLHARIRDLRQQQINRVELVNPVQKPRYDDVYKEGVAWLEELAGSPELEPTELTAEFSEDVWKSSTRKGEDVP